jgi:hypothetical protein
MSQVVNPQEEFNNNKREAKQTKKNKSTTKKINKILTLKTF